MAEDRSDRIAEDINWFMFDCDYKSMKNEIGFTHGLEFVTWCGDSHSFIVRDCDDAEYRITITKEKK